MNKFFSIIIPNYNGAHLLKKNLPKVIEAVKYYHQQAKNDVEIIIVDDASTDISVSVISNFKSQISSLKLIRNKKNLGFSSTVNKGVKESDGDIVVLLNTDIVPKVDFLFPLISHFKDSLIFAVGCMDKSIEGTKTILRGRGIGMWQRGFLMHRRGEIDKNNTLWVSCGSGAFKKSLWEKLGGLCELYNPFYWEDIDLSYRAKKSGYEVFFEKESIVVHEHEKGSIKNSYTKHKINTIAYRNQFQFVWINITDFSLIFSHVLWLPYHFLSAFKRGDWCFFIGFLQAFILIPSIIKLNSKNRKLFLKRDKEIIQQFII